LSDFRRVPAELAGLPPDVFSHSAEHHDLSGFKGRDVSVIGGGSSALDVVASLRAAGAHARLVARRPALKWNMPVEARRWPRWYPTSGLGDGWRNAFFEHAPMVFSYLPQETRMHIVGRWLGPAGGWPARRAVEQGPVLLGQALRGAEYRDGRVRLRLSGRDGRDTVVTTDHVIAATGYKVDLRRLGFLGEDLRVNLSMADHTPVLSPNFESSVPDLYFVGLAAANTFGPVMRFLLGARYTARRLTRHLSQPVPAH
jgi:thioredoxin reductase